ncbi:MAG: TolC family protein [Deltaproteobacteria bacterium]|nr:TolC family protein [Deltaproteobacteria bacterium]
MAKYIKQQTALPAEGLEVKSGLVKAEHELLTLENALAAQRENLNNLLGRDINTNFEVSEISAIDLPAIDLEKVKGRALEHRPEIKETRLTLEQAEYARSAKQSEYIPDVNLTVEYAKLQNVEMLPPDTAFAGLTMTWEPFDWGRKKAELAEKGRAITQARNAQRETKAQVLMDVTNQVRKVKENHALLNVRQVAQEVEREKLRVIMNKYGANATLLKDVLQTQMNLAGANYQYQQALLSFWTSRADLEKAIGEIK